MVDFVVYRCVVVLGRPYRRVLFGRGVYSNDIFMLVYRNGPLLSQYVRQRSVKNTQVQDHFTTLQKQNLSKCGSALK